MSSYDKHLRAQGSVPTLDGRPIDSIPSYYKAENQLPTDESTGLYRAAKEGSMDDVVKFLGEGGNPNWFHTEEEGATSLFAAVSKGDAEIARVLIEHGAAVEIKLVTTKETLLHVCCANGNLAMLEYLVQGPAQELLDCPNAFGNTPLHVACMDANTTLVQFLVDSGADTTLRNNRNSTALHILSYSEGDSENLSRIISILIEKGADVNATDSDGQTPLHGAAIKENIPVCRQLLENGAALDIRDNNGHVPQYYAQVKNNSTLIELLSLEEEKS